MFGNDTLLWKLYLWTTEEWVIFVELLLPFRSRSLYFHLLFKNLKTKIQNTINLAFASCGHESSSKEGDGLGVFKKAVSRRLFGPNLKWQEVGENCIMISFVISIREPELFCFTWFLNHTSFIFQWISAVMHWRDSSVKIIVVCLATSCVMASTTVVMAVMKTTWLCVLVVSNPATSMLSTSVQTKSASIEVEFVTLLMTVVIPLMNLVVVSVYVCQELEH